MTQPPRGGLVDSYRSKGSRHARAAPSPSVAAAEGGGGEGGGEGGGGEGGGRGDTSVE